MVTKNDLLQQRCCKYSFSTSLAIIFRIYSLASYFFFPRSISHHFHIVIIHSPSTWAGEDISVDAAELPPDTVINSNGAGDAFTSGLLVAAMLRHTGISMQYGSSPVVEEKDIDVDLDTEISSSARKVTPYSLYMKENYVALKAQCSDDKKSIFAKCNEMWEKESEEEKQMYERKAKEEMAKMEEEAAAQAFKEEYLSDLDSFPASPEISRKLNLVNQPMNLETAAQFASLVAARHVDTSTRDCSHLNINTIKEQSSVSAHGLEEI